jgi:glycine oxidase
MARATDCIIVGGGVVGLTAALRLRDAGVAVTVVDRAAPGQESSWAAAGILAPQVEAHGPGPLFELLRQSCRLWPGLAAELRERGGHDIGYREEGTLVVAPNDDDAAAAALTTSLQWQRQAGLRLELLEAHELRCREPSLAPAALAVWLPDDRQVDSRLLIRALVAACRAAGVDFVRAEVRRVDHDGQRVTGVALDDGVRPAGHVVVAAGAWSAQLAGVPLPDGAVFPVRGQMLELRPPAATLRHVVFGAGGYLVPRRDGRVLCGSTEERVGFVRATTAAALHELEARAARLCPPLATAPRVDHWAGLRPASRDGLPFIGPTAVAGLCLATGHFRNGIVLAPLTADIVAAIVTGAASPVDLAALSPARG